MLSGKEDKEVEEDLSWSHKSLDGVFRSFIGSSGVRVHYLGPQYVSPIFLFFFFFEKNRSIKTKKKKHTETAITQHLFGLHQTHTGEFLQSRPTPRQP